MIQDEKGNYVIPNELFKNNNDTTKVSSNFHQTEFDEKLYTLKEGENIKHKGSVTYLNNVQTVKREYSDFADLLKVKNHNSKDNFDIDLFADDKINIIDPDIKNDNKYKNLFDDYDFDRKEEDDLFDLMNKHAVEDD